MRIGVGGEEGVLADFDGGLGGEFRGDGGDHRLRRSRHGEAVDGDGNGGGAQRTQQQQQTSRLLHGGLLKFQEATLSFDCQLVNI